MSPLSEDVVSYPAKVQIFQLITTYMLPAPFSFCCFLPCKGTNFSANHNNVNNLVFKCPVVSYPAKVQIFQLITTVEILKRLIMSCFLPCKGTNFSANHNCEPCTHGRRKVVSYPAKVQIFQLITTHVWCLRRTCKLFLTLQRYKFFS